jgi:hypothetical protein
LADNDRVKATLKVIDRMQREGIIAHYAIGGGVGAAYYSEPATTVEIDVLVILPLDPNGLSGSLIALRNYFGRARL